MNRFFLGFLVLVCVVSTSLAAVVDQAVLGSVNNGGTIRAIVELDVPVQRERELTRAQVVSQRQQIANAQAQVRQALSAVGSPVDKAFSTTPGMALRVDADILQALQNSPLVKRIYEDRLSTISLNESNEVIEANLMWADVPPVTGAGYAVAVLDTGVDKNHGFFNDSNGAAVVAEYCASTSFNDGTEQVTSSFCPGGVATSIASGSGLNCDPGIAGCDHGTHVAGIVAGRPTSTSVGTLSGVAPGAGIIAAQVFSAVNTETICGPSNAPCALSFSSDQTLALEHVLSLNESEGGSLKVAAVNMSLGGGQYFGHCDGNDAAFLGVLNNLLDAGIAVAIATGNNGWDDSISSPACFSPAVSVGSTTKADGISYFSNVASGLVDLAAPGSSIASAVLSNNFAYKNGTSMATPHVAGAWALMRQALDDGSATPVSVILSALQDTATSVSLRESGTNMGFGLARINIAQAAGASVYTVTPSVTGNGSISPSTPQSVGEGNVTAFTLMPDSGHRVASVGGTCPAGSTSGDTYTTGAILADCTVVASFEQIPLTSHTVTSSAGAGGSISPLGSQTVEAGGTLIYTLTPDSGYEIVNVTGTCPYGGFSSPNAYETGAITGNCSVVANFQVAGESPLPPTINSLTAGNGSLTVSFTPNSSGPTADSYTATCVRAESVNTAADSMMEVGNRSDWHASPAFRTGGHRCGADEIQARHLQRGLLAPAASTADCSLSNTTISGEYGPLSSGAYVIPVYWHVISTNSGTGNVTDANINAQMAVLNEDFAAIFDTTVQFELVGITRTVNDGWFTDSPSDEAAYKSALGIDPSRYLNIYTNDAEGYLGYATFPAESAGDTLDGVVMNWAYVGGRNLPGASPYDLGRTLVHEVGHYLGLWHTFQGNGGQCANTFTSGDYIVDTWPHDSPDYGTSGTSVCGGVTDIENFMNYSDDAAMDRFTSQQSNRMICSLINYRPQLYSIESTGGMATGPSSPLTVTGLTNGTEYSCTVVANSSAGNSSLPSNALVGTPFAESFNVSVSASQGGSINPSNVQSILSGETASFQLTPDTGYQIESITGTCPYGDLSGNTYTTGPITFDCSLVANFMQTPIVTYTVSASASAGGNISPSIDQIVESGDTVTYALSADEGYLLDGINGTCPFGNISVNQDEYTTGPINANCSVEAIFVLAPVYYNVTPSSGSGGSISPSTTQIVLESESASFTLSPAINYEPDSVGGTCGGSLSGSTFTTNPITQDCTVSASFKLVSGTVPPAAPALSKVSVSETSASLQITPGAAGSDPITSYTTECSMTDLTTRAQQAKQTSSGLISLGNFSGAGMMSRSSSDVPARAFTANPQLFNATRSSILRIPLLDGSVRDMTISRRHTSQQGNTFIAAETEGVDWGRFLVRPDGNFFGSFVADGVTYEARIRDGQTLIYSSADGTVSVNPFFNDGLGTPATGSNSRALQQQSLSNDPVVITIGILYDAEWAGLSAIDRVSNIDFLITMANDSYQDSGVDLAFVVKDTAYYEPGSLSNLEQQLRTITCGAASCNPGTAVNTVVNDWRFGIKADMVVQLVGTTLYTGDGCGVAWIPSPTVLNDLSFWYHTYSVSALVDGAANAACPSIVVAHEMGHNLSLNHDWDKPRSLAAYSYGIGHKLSTGYGSVMSYPPGPPGSEPYAGYVPYLSNPDLLISNEPLGIDEGLPREADASKAVSNIAGLYELIFDNGDGASNLIAPPPLLTNASSTANSITLDFIPDKLYGQPLPSLFTANCSGATASGSASPITITGLSSATNYSCSVTASNEFGTSSPSNALSVTTQTNYYSVTATAGPNGSVSPSGTQQVAEGETKAFTVSPNTGFNIAAVTGCSGSLVGSVYTTAPITAACRVIATFVEQPPTGFTVRSSAGSGGSISPSGEQFVDTGTQATFLVTPDANYRISIVSGCDGSLDGNTFTTGPIKQDCVVTASFTRDTWVISGSSREVNFTSLPTGESFSCSTVATNLAGDSPSSNVVAFRTVAPSAPSQPVISNTESGDGEIYLYVTANDGGSPITNYRAECSDGVNTYVGESDRSPITISGLTNGTAYTCSVTVTNDIGTSSISLTTPPIVPEETAKGLPIWLLYQATQ